MLSQLLNQMDDYLTNKPFKRHWWSRRWIVHMTIQPPLTKGYPLWKRNKVEIRTFLKAKLEKRIEKGKNSEDNHVFAHPSTIVNTP